MRIPDSQPAPTWSSRSQLLHVPSSSTLLAVSTSSGRIGGYRITLARLVASDPSGLLPVNPLSHENETSTVQLLDDLHHFVRTPNGRGLLAIGEEGEIGVWSKEQVGRPEKGRPLRKALAGKGQWTMPSRPLQSAIFAKGRAMAFLTRTDDGRPTISLQHLDEHSSLPTDLIELPEFTLGDGDDMAMLLAVSDIDDGYRGRDRTTQRAIVMAVSKAGQAWCWRITPRNTDIVDGEAESQDDRPHIHLLHSYRLPIQGGGEPAWVLPVDPMGWHQSVIDWHADIPLQDMVLTISNSGVLEYWQPRLAPHSAQEAVVNASAEKSTTSHHTTSAKPWVRSGYVETSRSSIVNARCSSRKKTVLGEPHDSAGDAS